MKLNKIFMLVFLLLMVISISCQTSVLRHLSVPYSKFDMGNEKGFSIELIKKFCNYRNLSYEYVESDFKSIENDLSGTEVTGDIGDIISCGYVRENIDLNKFTYSESILPTQMVILSSANSYIDPIIPTGNTLRDVELTYSKISNISIASIPNTMFDIFDYCLKDKCGEIISFQGKVCELPFFMDINNIDAIMLTIQAAECILTKYPGKYKIIGPVSDQLTISAIFKASDKNLIKDFDRFMRMIKSSGEFIKLVRKYYPNMIDIYPRFFRGI